jgi:hypothetical protein
MAEDVASTRYVFKTGAFHTPEPMIQAFSTDRFKIPVKANLKKRMPFESPFYFVLAFICDRFARDSLSSAICIKDACKKENDRLLLPFMFFWNLCQVKNPKITLRREGQFKPFILISNCDCY